MGERRLALLEGSQLPGDLRQALLEAGYELSPCSAAELLEGPPQGVICPDGAALEPLLRYWERHTHLVVHDLKSPFAGLAAYLEVLQMDPASAPPPGSTLARATDGALECAGELRHMLQAIVDLHRLDVGQLAVHPAPSELRDVAAHGSAAFVASRHSGRLEERFGADPVWALCDPSVTSHIVSQLVLHALRYAADRGPVRVAVDRGPEGAPSIEVRADGPPLPESARTHLFDRYARAAPPHEKDSYLFGLGLPFAHAAAHAQGGSLVAENDERGTLFRLRLPASEAP